MLITVILLSVTVVSAANNTDTADVDTIESTQTQTTELITKKTSDDVTKTSTNNNKTASKVSLSSQTLKYNTTVNLTAKVTNAKTGAKITSGKVVFKINDKTVGYATVNKGIASFIYKASVLSPKTYNITAKYGETSTTFGSSAKSTLKIVKDTSKILVKNATVTCNETVKITAVITNSKGVAVTDGKVAFKLNGKTIGHANVTNGKAILTYRALNLSAKTYLISAVYGGNKFYESSRSTYSSFIVKARTTKIFVTKVSGYSTTVQLKATAIDKAANKYLTSETVVFKINGITVGNSTIKNGKASLTCDTTELARGNYTVTAILKPSSYYAAASANGTLTILAQKNFTLAQIKEAAIAVRTQYEINKNVSTVYIGKSRIGLSDFLALMIRAVNNTKNNKGYSVVPFVQYKTLTTQTDSLKTGVMKISQVLDIGTRTLKYMNTYNIPPKSISTAFGTMGYYNIIYTYTRVLELTTPTYLPTTCKVYNWAYIHPSNPKSRTIYITSDVIYSKTKDYAFMNSIKKALEAKGYTAVVNGYGPNSHNTAMRAQTLPANAVQLSIFGGADAGVIYDISTRSYMRLKENRLLFLVYTETSKDITNLSFLERAHDDNYSASSFKGIYYPDDYLYEHGYNYVYSSNVNTIVNALIAYMS